MSIAILGRKVGMTQVYDADGTLIPVTVIQAGPCTILQVKNAESDGYEAIQMGYLNQRGVLQWRATEKAANGADTGCFEVDLAKIEAVSHGS